MNFSKGLSSVRGIRRFGTITRVLFKHGLGDVGERLFSVRDGKSRDEADEEHLFKAGFPSPRRIRLVLEELGPSFIKLGQLMSTRADLFPPEYIEEFKKLQDSVPPIPFGDVKAVIEKELKRPLDSVFASFDPDSIAAASVGQVHMARLFTGEKVAVKIIRPGIEKKIREDVRLMYNLAEKVERAFEVGRIIGAVNLVKEFERIIFRELDMLIEAGSIEKFASNFKEDDEIYIPKVYWEQTTKSVLVMEHIDGIKMDDVERIQAHGIDPRDVALIGLRSFSRQLMQFGFFHADPHPGNTIVMYDGRVSLVDFGITGYLDDETMRQIANLFLGYAEHDYDMIMDALQEAGLINDETMDLTAFRIDLKDMSEAFYGRSLQNISVRDVYDQVMQLVLKYHVHLPRNLMLLLKTFIQTEALGKILGSDASLLEVTRPYARQLLQRGIDARSMLKNLGRDARITGGYMKTVPRYVHDILKQTARGRQAMELRHTGFESLNAGLEKSVNRLTVGMIIAASIIGGAMILNSGQKILEFTLDWLGFQNISLTALLGVMGYVVATVLGLWLVLSIFRSGKL
ncbi:AarF/ABC1/UbiB kinase family protein [Desulforhabdus sp. TSK]|uniref:ABC1 kinase family protein n=1 Tax=Desulforhabdus sp. TSK TaxID=2925014 RepID=UPI001FC8CE6D|nr:AarF/UbiB family protein [Desulforhabdus sp. TSK]GKT10756.1 ubiquinone biosynthesis protein UbiB [Desulforhabdus sp. TSK]